ncbi:MAG: hypothetical protein LUD69_08000, partial [Oscillospiraceae bacterium]|nr:hypothetical protein [Oscillospiraceae bacterium]
GGVLTATGADISGSITATSGTIGGFTISSTCFFSGNGVLTYAGMYCPSTITSNSICFYAGASTSAPTTTSTSSFYVTYGGVMYATGAIVSGEITATSGTIYNDVNLGGALHVYDNSSLTTEGGYVGYLAGSSGKVETDGIGVIDATGYNYLIATNAGVRMTSNSDDGDVSLYLSGGKITATGAATFSGTLTVGSTMTVSGAATFNAGVRLANGKYLYWRNSSSAYVGMIYLTTANDFYLGNVNYPTYIRGSTVYVGNASCPTYIRGSNIYINGTTIDTYIANNSGSNISLATSAPSSLDDGKICLVYI